MEIKIDSRILSKDGILLFSQRYMNLFFITVMPDTLNYYVINLNPRTSNAAEYSKEFLQNELLDCEFLSCRYKETIDFREAVRQKILTACEGQE